MAYQNPYLTELPAAPPELIESARRAWDELGRASISAGRLTGADLHVLELASRSLASVRQLEAVIEREGHVIDTGTALKANPALAALDRARGHCRALLGELGLSRSGRKS